MGRKSRTTFTHDGVTDTIKGWAERLGLEYNALYARLYVLKWPVEKALAHRNLRPRAAKGEPDVSG